MTRTFTHVITFLLVSFFSLSSLSAMPTDGTCDAAAEMTFTSYGFGYVKVKHTVTGKAFYIISENVITHCCGDIGQMNKMVLSINNEASNFITTWLQDPLDEYTLIPSFSKCLKTESEAEAIRKKKIQLFKQLGSKVYEAKMNLPLAGGCQ